MSSGVTRGVGGRSHWVQAIVSSGVTRGVGGERVQAIVSSRVTQRGGGGEISLGPGHRE